MMGSNRYGTIMVTDRDQVNEPTEARLTPWQHPRSLRHSSWRWFAGLLQSLGVSVAIAVASSAIAPFRIAAMLAATPHRAQPRTAALATAIRCALMCGALAMTVSPAKAAIAFSDLNGANGFRLHGAAVNDSAGRAVAPAGDFNDDGLPDLLISAPYASPGGRQHAGSTYIVFGRQFDNFTSAIALSALGPRTGYRLDGLAAEDYSGRSIATAGDINSDGIDDLIVGARSASPPGISHGGVAYVVFGARPPEIFDDGFE
jgi:hypothetical protein